MTFVYEHLLRFHRWLVPFTIIVIDRILTNVGAARTSLMVSRIFGRCFFYHLQGSASWWEQPCATTRRVNSENAKDCLLWIGLCWLGSTCLRVLTSCDFAVTNLSSICLLINFYEIKSYFCVYRQRFLSHRKEAILKCLYCFTSGIWYMNECVKLLYVACR